MVVGEPYWRAWPPPEGREDRDAPYTSLDETVTSIESHGFSVVTLIAASQEWLGANEGEPDAAEVRSMHEASKRRYLRYRRDSLGWAIFVCRKPPD